MGNLLRSFLRAAVAGTLVLCAIGAWAAGAPVGGAVGTVSLLVGQAYAISGEGQSRPLERGASLHVGDRIETLVGGHVHVQFVDGGRLSVRPMSRLVIEDYVDPKLDRLGSSGIRFRLELGVVRSITGQWGEAARDRFRLNTPLAAIGVKGTDFAVRVDRDKTAAAVYTGAIVLAPLDNACAATTGPCVNGRERVLTESMKGQMVEISRSQTAPELVPAVDLLAQSSRLVPLAAAQGGAGSRVGRASSAPMDGSVSEVLVADTARQASNLPPPVADLFAWGRSAGQPSDGLSRPSGELFAEGARPTVGTFTYTLFTRAPPLSAGDVLGGGQASASLRLASSQANLVDIYGQAIESVSVTGGMLNLDFVRALFSTTLNLSGITLGTDVIRASGSISSAGLFYSGDGSQLVAGAVSPDGKQAGYLFEKRVNPGIVRGITLWGR